jgi:transcriptional regulator of acetoin/glycerol metabolism
LQDHHELDPRIAASWSRCYRQELRYKDTPQALKNYELGLVSRAMTRNELLIDAAKSVFNQIYRFQDNDWPYYLELVDKDNVRLFEKGFYDDNVFSNPIPGEETIGTSCHTLMREYHCPMQIFGPENYLEICKHLVWGAPIFDEDNNYCGGVFLSERLTGTEWKDIPINTQINNLHFVCALATAVERSWLAKKYGKRCESEKDYRDYITELAINLMDDGVLILDRDGYIINANKQATDILMHPASKKKFPANGHCQLFEKP